MEDQAQGAQNARQQEKTFRMHPSPTFYQRGWPVASAKPRTRRTSAGSVCPAAIAAHALSNIPVIPAAIARRANSAAIAVLQNAAAQLAGQRRQHFGQSQPPAVSRMPA